VLLAIAAAAAALLAVAADVLGPPTIRRWRARRDRPRREPSPVVQDPGRELRAEQRARALLRSCVNPEEWEMYRDLGFLKVQSTMTSDDPHGPCAYLLYPHQPIVAYLPGPGRLLAEYCVSFEDPARPHGGGRLPDSDDVLAKWMALTGDEQRLIATANMHLPGRQVDPARVRRDLRRLAQWDQDRARRLRRSSPAPAQPLAPSAS
jgi:hypothetical protein